jgi:hypothetical protein
MFEVGVEMVPPPVWSTMLVDCTGVTVVRWVASCVILGMPAAPPPPPSSKLPATEATTGISASH